MRTSDYRAYLDRRGDFEIGVLARRRLWRSVFVSAAGLVFVALAGWLYVSLRPGSPGVVSANRFPVKVACIRDECGYSGVVEVTPADRFPLECPECGQRSCKQLWRCRDCGYEFVPPPEMARETVTCENCGSTRVGTAARANTSVSPP